MWECTRLVINFDQLSMFAGVRVFEPNAEVLETYDLCARESLVVVTDEQLCVPIENPQGTPIHVEGGVRIGTVWALEGPLDEVHGGSVYINSLVKAITHSPERLDRLLISLNRSCHLKP